MFVGTFDTITKAINSPVTVWCGHLAAGAVLAGIVWKFFERVEAVLTENTKLEIAVWVLDVKVADHVPWPDTFQKVFESLFGKEPENEQPDSFRSVVSLAAASFGVAILLTVRVGLGGPRNPHALVSMSAALPTIATVTLTVTPGLVYLGLRFTRFCLDSMKDIKLWLWSVVIVVDFAFKSIVGLIAWMALFFFISGVWAANYDFHNLDFTPIMNFSIPITNPAELALASLLTYSFSFCVLPLFLSSIWLWLYAASGFILRAAQRLDLSLGWFISITDIEKKPLQSIGLVAGAIVALVYWGAVIVSRVW